MTDFFDPHQNIWGGVRLLADLLDHFRGNTALALAAYNAGQGAVKRYSGIPPRRADTTAIPLAIASVTT